MGALQEGPEDRVRGLADTGVLSVYNPPSEGWLVPYEGGAKSLVIRKPDDFHVHLRDGRMLDYVGKFTAKHFRRALVMPNLDKPVLNVFNAEAYRHRIIQSLNVNGPPDEFTPLMTIKLTDETTPNDIRGIFTSGAGGPKGYLNLLAAKYYPRGVTTNSTDGVSNPEKVYPILELMEEHGLVLCLHAEEPGVFSLEREEHFVRRWLGLLRERFPKLKIVVEHVSSTAAADIVALAGPNVAATVTVHHLLLTLDDVIGDKLKPHHFCKPIAKRAEDRETLLDYVTSGNPKFFLGTDSAPHAKSKKECADCCAGVFTAPVALALLAEIFEDEGRLIHLENFVSMNGAKFYGLEPNKETLTLVKESWEVPDEYPIVISQKSDDLVPFRAGETLTWRAWPDPKDEP